MNRRGFLGSILALAAAPAIVRADSLMRIVPLDTTIFRDGYIVVEAVNDGVTDMSPIIRRALDRASRLGVGVWLKPGEFRLGRTLYVTEHDNLQAHNVGLHQADGERPMMFFENGPSRISNSRIYGAGSTRIAPIAR